MKATELTSLKTMAMRLRSTKSDMEAAGADTEGMADSVSKLREEIKALSGVDIQLDDNTYKSSYQMLKELAEVWETLDDLTQANITELLFGKRQANVGSAILSNWQIAEDALQTALGASGSAAKENEVYLNSIQGKLDVLSASFQDLSQKLLNSDLVKGVIDFLTKVVDLLGEMDDNFGTIITTVIALSAVDMFSGFKGWKAVVTGISAISDAFAIMKTKAEIGSSVGSLNFAGQYKSAEGLAASFTAIKGFIASFAPLLLAALPLVIALGFGIKATADAMNDSKIKDLEKAKTDYSEITVKLQEYNDQLDKNIARLEELNGIPIADRNVAEQEEIDKLERENELLAAQIAYQEKLAEVKNREVVSAAQDAFYNTLNYEEKNNVWTGGESKWFRSVAYGSTQGNDRSAYLDSYNEAVARAAEIDQQLSILYAEGETENQKEIEKLEASKLNTELVISEMLANLLEWRNALSGAGDEISVAIVGAIDKAINAEDASFSKIADDQRFAGIIEQIKGNVSVTSKQIENDFGTTGTAFFEALKAANIDFNDFCDSFKTESSDTADKLISDISDVSDATKSLDTSFSTLSSAFKEQSENGELSVGAIFDIIDAGYAAALVVDKETGAVTLNAQMYMVLAKAKVVEQIASLRSQQAEIQSAIAMHAAAMSAAELTSQYALLASVNAQIAAMENIDFDAITSGLYSVGSAASSAASKISSLYSGLSTLISQTISMLKQDYDDGQESITKSLESQKDAIEDAKDASKDRWDAEKDALDDALDSYEKLIDAQIELLEREKAADDYAKSKAEKEKAVSNIQNQLAAIQFDDSVEAQKQRLELEAQLQEAQDDLKETQSDREYELRKQVLEDEKDRYSEEIKARIDGIEKASDADQKAYEAQIDRIQSRLDSVRDASISEAEWRARAYDMIENHEEELYQKLLSYNKLYGDGQNETVVGWFKAAEGWRAYGDTLEEAMDNLIRLQREAEAAGGGIAAVAQATSSYIQQLIIDLQQMASDRAAKGEQAWADSLSKMATMMQLLSDKGVELDEDTAAKMTSILNNCDRTTANVINGTLAKLFALADSGSVAFDDLWGDFIIAISNVDSSVFVHGQNIADNFIAIGNAAAAATSQIAMMNALAAQADLRNGLGNSAWDINAAKQEQLHSHAGGGVVDYTGLAMLHGKTDSAEVVFNAAQAAKLFDYVNNTPNLLAAALQNGSALLKGANGIQPSTSSNASMGDINIVVQGNADASAVAELKRTAQSIKDEVIRGLNESLTRRGVARSPRTV